MKRRLIIIVVCLLAVLLLLTVLLGSHSKKQAGTTVTQQTPQGVNITNMASYSDSVDISNVPSVQRTLYDRIKETIKSPAASYEANVRQGSLTTVYNDYSPSDAPVSVPTTNFLVDIPKAQRTFVVSISGGPDYPYNILHVLCPSAEQNAYAPFSCEDKEQ
jgi:hypothetical protein